MGGDRETIVPAAKPGKKSGETLLGNLRIHENKGEVHFHDDTLGLKAAVPVADFFRAWEAGKTRSFSPKIEILAGDGKGGNSLLIIERDEGQFRASGALDINLRITKVVTGSTFRALEEFVNGG